MLVEVHVTGEGKLIRASDEQQIGEIYMPVLFRAEESIYMVNGKLVSIKHGFVDENGEFHQLCTGIGCSFECLKKNRPNCRYCLKGGEQKLYVEI